MKILITISSVSVILFSCGVKKSLLKKNYEINKIVVLGEINKIEIIDNRKNTTSRQLKIPTISFPGQSDIIQPELTQSHKDSILKQVRSYFKNEKNQINIKIEIIEGIKEFKANAFNEREYAQFDTKITLSNLNSNEEKNCSSSAFFEAKSIDASTKFIDKIYFKSMRTAIYKCFEKLTE